MLLTIGSTGPAVVALQDALTKAGYDPKGVDGKYGPNTSAAVKAYQTDWHMPVTGMADDSFQRALGLNPSPGSSNNPVFKSGGASAVSAGGTAAVAMAQAELAKAQLGFAKLPTIFGVSTPVLAVGGAVALAVAWFVWKK